MFARLYELLILNFLAVSASFNLKCFRYFKSNDRFLTKGDALSLISLFTVRAPPLGFFSIQISYVLLESYCNFVFPCNLSYFILVLMLVQRAFVCR